MFFLSVHDLPVPKGYGNPAAVMPQALTLAESMTPAVNRFHLVLLSAADLKREKAGKQATWDRYLMVHTNRKAETARFSESQFANIRNGFVEQQATLVEKHKEAIQRVVEDGARKISAATPGEAFSVNVGETLPLGMFANNRDSVAAGSLVKLTFQGGGRTMEQTMVVAMAIGAVKQKLVFFNVYGAYRTKADIDDVKQTISAWLADIAAANK